MRDSVNQTAEADRKQGIQWFFINWPFKILVKKKLLKGRRGKGGGYQLTREPSEYTIGEILELAEGNLATVACLVPGAEVCSREEQCITLPLWKKFDGKRQIPSGMGKALPLV